MTGKGCKYWTRYSLLKYQNAMRMYIAFKRSFTRNQFCDPVQPSRFMIQLFIQPMYRRGVVSSTRCLKNGSKTALAQRKYIDNRV